MDSEDLINSGQRLPVMEQFYSIQGEGKNSGAPAYFVRLGGCEVGCHWCDVKESWDAGLHKVVDIKDIVNDVLKSGAVNVVITGGEPAMYNLTKLCALLKSHNLRLWLETSGAYPILGEFDWICVSPKKFKTCLRENLMLANELKCIVYNKSDFEWAEVNRKEVKNGCTLFLQPEWSVAEKMLPEIIDYVKLHPDWNISLQTHKWMGVL